MLELSRPLGHFLPGTRRELPQMVLIEFYFIFPGVSFHPRGAGLGSGPAGAPGHSSELTEPAE